MNSRSPDPSEVPSLPSRIRRDSAASAASAIAWSTASRPDCRVSRRSAFFSSGMETLVIESSSAPQPDARPGHGRVAGGLAAHPGFPHDRTTSAHVQCLVHRLLDRHRATLLPRCAPS